MKEILKLYKRPGETPLECVDRFRSHRPEYADINMTYLGRLDPMAEGLLLVLAGDTRDKDSYLDFDKAYEFEVLWGFATDTYDALGMVTETGRIPLDLEKKMPKLLRDIARRKTQSYPPYSSKTVQGKPLHAWAREGRIDDVEIPTRSIKVFNIEHVRTRLVKQTDLLKDIVERVSEVKGDFRQNDIVAQWKRCIDPDGLALVSLFHADVSSGTYIRSIASEMGNLLGTRALAFSIKRTRIGEHRL